MSAPDEHYDAAEREFQKACDEDECQLPRFEFRAGLLPPLPREILEMLPRFGGDE